MELPINTDPQDLNKNRYGGQKWWQYLCIAIAFISAIIVTVLSSGKLSSTVSSLIICVVVVPFGYVGIFKRNGLNFFEYLRTKQNTMGKKGVYVYVSEPVTDVKTNYLGVEEDKKNKKKRRLK